MNDLGQSKRKKDQFLDGMAENLSDGNKRSQGQDLTWISYGKRGPVKPDAGSAQKKREPPAGKMIRPETGSRS